MKNILSLVRPNIQKLKPYVSARSLCQKKELIFMDANENPYGDGIKNRYPDPLQNELREKIANIHSLKVENILMGNGSDELIDMLIRVFCEPGTDSISVCTPTFGMYQTFAQINNVDVQKIPLTPEFQLNVESICQSESKILFLPNPNAPTGNLFDSNDLKTILKKFNGVVVLDEAYVDFSSQKSWTSQLEKSPNLVVIQTFSKYWGLAGCRVGTLFASVNAVDAIAKIKPPYNINRLSAQAVLSVLENKEEVEKNAQTILREREILRKNLSALSFIQNVYPSETNFLWIKCKDAWKVYDFLKSKGIVIRKYSNKPNFLRISVGLPTENTNLLNLLTTFKK